MSDRQTETMPAVTDDEGLQPIDVHPPIEGQLLRVERPVEDRVCLTLIKLGAVLGLLVLEAVVLLAVAHALGVG